MKKLTTVLLLMLAMLLCASSALAACAYCGGDTLCDECGGLGFVMAKVYGSDELAKVACPGTHCSNGRCTECTRMITCSACGGSKICSECKGSGFVLMQAYGSDEKIKIACAHCDNGSCSSCGGTGQTAEAIATPTPKPTATRKPTPKPTATPKPTPKPITVSGYNRSSDRYEYIAFGELYVNGFSTPLTWRVLTVSGNQALLLCEEIIECRKFDSKSNKWSYSSIKTWCNDTFYNKSFTSSQKNAIIDTGVGNVFILSESELTNPSYGFSSSLDSADDNRSAYGSIYACERGLWRSSDGHGTYFGRSRAGTRNVQMVSASGKIQQASVDRDNVGVRPAIWVNLRSLKLSSGSGTYSNPYR